KHSVALAKLMLDANLAERIARVQEAQVLQLAGAVRMILERLQLTEEQQALARTAVPEVLRSIPARSVEDGT
ncbi:MAG TPA: hypothetical protein VHH13_09120, partial [Arthrobacter sp.]|nr:hypothetical protein [Arthrobacter sp.]